MQYKLPTRLDMGRLHVEFESSYEPTGLFGAKSIGEIVIKRPRPRSRTRSTTPPACGTASCLSRRKRCCGASGAGRH